MRRTLRPQPPLSGHVEELWLHSGYRPSHDFERLLPAGTLELVVNLSDQPLRCYHPDTLKLQNAIHGPLLSGARTGYSVIDTEQQREMIGVQFRPGGAHALLGLPVDEVEGLDLPLETLWGDAANELYDRLLEASSPARQLAILEQALLRRMRTGAARPHPVIVNAIAQLDQTDAPIEIGALAARASWSDRHFIRTFHQQVGITPKAFGRIRRFQAALRRIHEGRNIDWSEIALSCGYYDQAHFIRDFKAFSGMTPGAFRKLASGNPNCVPLPKVPVPAPLTPRPARELRVTPSR